MASAALSCRGLGLSLQAANPTTGWNPPARPIHSAPLRHKLAPVTCQAAQSPTNSRKGKGAGLLVSPPEVARASDYGRLAQFFAVEFFLDGDDNSLRYAEQARFSADVASDLRARYSGNQAAVLSCREASSGKVVGMVAVGAVPFRGATALLKQADVDATRGRGGKRGEDKATVKRPVVANLAVKKEYRRQGLARRLMLACEEICVDWGYGEIWLLVEAGNTRALKLYRKLGYRKVRDDRGASSFKVVDGEIEEVSVTNVYMRKSLKGGLVGALENTDWVQVAVGASLAGGLFYYRDIILSLAGTLGVQ
eukprot:jgi/Mesvir1/17621/Mv08847-RA.1